MDNISVNFDLSKIFKSDREFLKGLDELKELSKEYKKYKGKILSSKKVLKEFLDLEEKTGLLLEKVYVYAYLGYYSCMSDTKFQEFIEKVGQIEELIDVSSSFALPEILKSNYEDVLKLLDEEELKKYKFKFEQIFRYKNHTLSEEEEKILSKMSEIFRMPESSFEALDNVDIFLGYISDEKHKKVELTNSNYSKYLSSKNKRVRKEAFNSLYKFYENHINVMSSLYLSQIKIDEIYSKIKVFDSGLESSLYSDNISVKLYESLIKSNNNNLDILKEYYKVKKEALGIKEMHMYDLNVNISKLKEKNIPYSDGLKIISEALKPLGEDYLTKLNEIITDGFIDVYPKKSKRSGAFQLGSFKTNYVLTNYENNFESVSTLIHELGHAMHSHYSDLNQDYTYSHYPIFLAEIASTVNQILLNEYMLKNAKTKDEKIYYLSDFLDDFKATVYRQTMFAEFEYKMHNEYNKGTPITKDLLCSEYYKLNVKNFSPVIIVDENIKYEWSRIPHFYTSFYVYKYSTGFISALLIANKLLKGDTIFRDKYIKFLSSGGSNYPLNTLKELGIDIENVNTLNEAYKIFESKLNVLKELI